MFSVAVFSTYKTHLIPRLSHYCLLSQLNDSVADQQESVVHTGTDDINLLCKFKQWNGMEKLDIWFGDDANTLKGTEGLFFHPFIEKGEPLEAFVDDVWRSFHLNYTEDTEHLGIRAYRYKLDQREFWSAHHYRRNAMYGSWCPDGLLYMGVTQHPGVCVCLCVFVCLCVHVCMSSLLPSQRCQPLLASHTSLTETPPCLGT